jgi:hypothetical protein
MTARMRERNSCPYSMAIPALGLAFLVGAGCRVSRAEIDGLADTYIAVTWRVTCARTPTMGRPSRTAIALARLPVQ